MVLSGFRMAINGVDSGFRRVSRGVRAVGDVSQGPHENGGSGGGPGSRTEATGRAASVPATPSAHARRAPHPRGTGGMRWDGAAGATGRPTRS